jgi:hypothetical protein
MTVHTISLASLAKICPAETEAFRKLAENESVLIGEMLRAIVHATPGHIDIPDASEVFEKAEAAFERLSQAFEEATAEGDHRLKLEIHDTKDAGLILRVARTMMLSPPARKYHDLLKCVQADIQENLCDMQAEAQQLRA